jgi:hypothetical protein
MSTAPAAPATAAPPARRAPFAPFATPATSFAPDETLSFAELATLLFACFARVLDLLLLLFEPLRLALLLLFEAEARDRLLFLALPFDGDADFDAPDDFPLARFDELLPRRADPELADAWRPRLPFVWGIFTPPSPFGTTSSRGSTHFH